MDYKNLFEQFDSAGKLILPDKEISFADIPWSKHPAFEGVELKHIVTYGQTDGHFSYHLVRIAPNKKIGNHIHKTQLKTHEVISGNGVCISLLNGSLGVQSAPIRRRKPANEECYTCKIVKRKIGHPF